MAGNINSGLGSFNIGGFTVSGQTFADVGGAVSDIFGGIGAAESAKIQSQGEAAEAQNYFLAAQLASENKEFTVESTAIQEAQASRQIALAGGAQVAETAGAGFERGKGSAFYIAKSIQQQGALEKQVLGQQGLITEAGYQEQAQAYTTLAYAAENASQEESSLSSFDTLAGFVGAAFKVAAAVV